MVTLGQYSRIQDAQRDANLLADRGIEAFIVNQHAGAPLPGLESIELQVHQRDLPKLKEIGGELQEELDQRNSRQCPKCGSPNYDIKHTFWDVLASYFVAVETSLTFRCKDCGAKFIEE